MPFSVNLPRVADSKCEYSVTSAWHHKATSRCLATFQTNSVGSAPSQFSETGLRPLRNLLSQLWCHLVTRRLEYDVKFLSWILNDMHSMFPRNIDGGCTAWILQLLRCVFGQVHVQKQSANFHYVCTALEHHNLIISQRFLRTKLSIHISTMDARFEVQNVCEGIHNL